MSSGQASGAGKQTVVTEAPSLADVLKKTRTESRDDVDAGVKIMIDEILSGSATFEKSSAKTLDKMIQQIDAKLSKQLRAVMHDEKFLKLEGSWRGLRYLVFNTETATDLQIKVLCCSKQELSNDLENAKEFDQSTIFKHIYRDEFGMAGGNPYAAIVGDYEIENNTDDIGMLEKMSNVAAAAFCPFLTSPAPSMFGFSNWTSLPDPRDLALTFTGPKYVKWNAFRKSEDSRFVAMTFPRVLARDVYGVAGKKVQDFNYQEVEVDADGETALAQEHQRFCWMNAAYTLATRITAAYSQTGFCTRILGMGDDGHGGGGGGRLEDLPVFAYREVDGLLEMKCPTEINIDDRRANEINKLGFIPLINWKRTNTAAFISGDTCNLPKEYDRDFATENAQASAWLPHMLAVGRFSHFLKVMGRNWLGRSLEPEDIEVEMNRWIKNYVCDMKNPSESQKAELPLKDARVEVQKVGGEYGHYSARVLMNPWTPLRQLTANMSMVTEIPTPGGS